MLRGFNFQALPFFLKFINKIKDRSHEKEESMSETKKSQKSKQKKSGHFWTIKLQ